MMALLVVPGHRLPDSLGMIASITEDGSHGQKIFRHAILGPKELLASEAFGKTRHIEPHGLQGIPKIGRSTAGFPP